jgi:ParB-like chromosome segregation protein Spo0J
MKYRHFRMIPLDAIEVTDTCGLDEGQIEKDALAANGVGLLKPILVNKQFLKQTGKYELICGRRSYFAYKQLGKKKIEAEIIRCNRKQARLISLVESYSRFPPGTMWFEREMKRMHDAGMLHKEIAEIVGKSEAYVIDCISLVEEGDRCGKC